MKWLRSLGIPAIVSHDVPVLEEGSAIVPISYADKLRILCHLSGCYEEGAFVAAYQAEQIPGERDPYARIASGQARWFAGTQPHAENKRILIAMIKTRKNPIISHDIRYLLEEEWSIFRFLEMLQISFTEIRDKLTLAGQKDWDDRYIGMPFMEALSVQARTRAADQALKSMKGVYFLYRLHSVLPGILREIVIVRGNKDLPYNEVDYIQYNKDNKKNDIKMNMFYAGFYMFIAGARQRHGTGVNEIITVDLIIQNMINPDQSVDYEQRHFVGLLTGIYDYDNVLMGERVLLRKTQIREGTHTASTPVRLLHVSPDHRLEYETAYDVIANNLDGQALAVRLSRLEMIAKLDWPR